MGTEITFVPATSADVELLAPELRPEDVAEVQALGYPDALSALDASLSHSAQAYTARAGERVLAMLGVIPVVIGDQSAAQVWFLTGSAFPRYAKSFSKGAQVVLASWLRTYARLGNLIDARYFAAVRYARWLGFEIRPAIAVPTSDVLFHPAILERRS